MVKAIKKAETTLRVREENKKKSENDSELNQARKDAFGYIEKEMNWKGLKAQDLGEYSNYRERINGLSEVWEIRDLREEIILNVISKLGRKHNPNYNNNQNDANNTSQTGAGNTGNPNENGTNNGRTTNNNATEEPEEPNNSNSSNKTNIPALKKQIASVIKNALSSPEPKLTNSDLDSEYQDWENKLNKLVEENEINSWKDKVLAHIEAQKKAKKVSQKVDDDFNKTQDPNATIQDKKDALDELDKNEGEQAYEAKKEQIKETEKEVAKDNPNEYRDKLISSLDKKLAENGLNENDLDDKTKQEIKEFKNSTNLEPEKLVETKMRLFEKFGQAGAKKKVDNLVFEVEKVLKSGEKVQVEKLKKELLEILNSSNVYYFSHKSQVEKLLKQLESIKTSNKNTTGNPLNPLSLSAKIGIGVVIALVFGFFMFLVWRGKRTDSHPWKYRTRRG